MLRRILSVIALAALERLLPYREAWLRPVRDVGTDTVHLVGSYAVQGLGRIAWGA